MRPSTTCPEQVNPPFYGPHLPGTQICGGVIARGAQGQFPDRFCFKTQCRFLTHATKLNLPKMVKGGFYVKENKHPRLLRAVSVTQGYRACTRGASPDPPWRLRVEGHHPAAGGPAHGGCN